MMNWKKIIALTALGCSLMAPLCSAEVVPQYSRSVGKKLTLPHVVLDKKASKNADEAVRLAVDSFRMMHAGMERVTIDYEVVCDNYECVALLLKGGAYNDGMPHPGKETHGLVISKKNGKPMELKQFVHLSNLDILKERVANGQCRVVFIDRRTELNQGPVERLKMMPDEFIIDEAACVYLLLTEQASYVTDTPLVKIDIDKNQDIYVTKG